MFGERLDDENERGSHRTFVGRVALLVRLDQVFVTDDTDRWIIAGGPGLGTLASLEGRMGEVSACAGPHAGQPALLLEPSPEAIDG